VKEKFGRAKLAQWLAQWLKRMASQSQPEPARASQSQPEPASQNQAEGPKKLAAQAQAQF
jgi:hypothetical protein